MASAHGISEGTRNLAVLKREDGVPNAWELMEQLRSDPRLWKSKNVIKLRDQWENPKFKPTLPKAWLEYTDIVSKANEHLQILQSRLQ